MQKTKRKNKKAITEDQIKGSVRAKAERMKAELSRNPGNTVTAQRLAEFKKIHTSKLA